MRFRKIDSASRPPSPENRRQSHQLIHISIDQLFGVIVFRMQHFARLRCHTPSQQPPDIDGVKRAKFISICILSEVWCSAAPAWHFFSIHLFIRHEIPVIDRHIIGGDCVFMCAFERTQLVPIYVHHMKLIHLYLLRCCCCCRLRRRHRRRHRGAHIFFSRNCCDRIQLVPDESSQSVRARTPSDGEKRRRDRKQHFAEHAVDQGTKCILFTFGEFEKAMPFWDKWFSHLIVN